MAKHLFHNNNNKNSSVSSKQDNSDGRRQHVGQPRSILIYTGDSRVLCDDSNTATDSIYSTYSQNGNKMVYVQIII